MKAVETGLADLRHILYDESEIVSKLTAASGARKIVLADPIASAWPPPFFEGVHVMGGVHVRDGDKLLPLVSEGGSGYFFETVAEKRCIIKEDLS